MSRYSPERQWPRLAPANSMMVSVFTGRTHAYGLIANVSEAGASIVAGVHFEPTSRLLLRIGFHPQEKPFSTEADVIWSRDDSESEGKPTFVHGVKFILASELQRQELRAILKNPGFVAPVIPGKPPDACKLDEMMMELNQDLELVDKIGSEPTT